MSERAVIARRAAQGLRDFAANRGGSPVTIGFDGFVDSIIAVVDKRQDFSRYEPVRTIEQFGRKILAAAGMSSNYEMVVKLQKLGGNGPIMAAAMAGFGLPVTYLGAVGKESIHPVFAELARQARVINVANPGLTDALEFADGKLLLGKYDWLAHVDWAYLDKAVGHQRLLEMCAGSRLIGMVNWTMMPGLSDIWRNLVKVLPRPADGSGRRIFVDLADPEKRTREDLRDALKQCGELQTCADVTLGLNLKESVQVAQSLGIDAGADAEARVEALSADILAKTGVSCVVIHPRKIAAAAARVEGRVQTSFFAGPFVAEPRLSTGAGDNFNAGFCLGQLAGLSLAQCLCAGTAASGYYVRQGGSPSLEDLADFCNHLPAPQ